MGGNWLVPEKERKRGILRDRGRRPGRRWGSLQEQRMVQAGLREQWLEEGQKKQ